MSERLKVLFTGYAPVHFLCFKPLFQRLLQHEDVDVYVAGGLREKIDDEYVFHPLALYLPLGVPANRILTMAEIRNMDFDVLFGANTKLLQPRSAGRKVQIFHGISFRNRAIRSANLGADHFFLAGPYMERKFIEAGLLEPDDPRTVRTGFMKTDRLVDGSQSRGELLEANGFDGNRPVILYAPTGQKHCSLDLVGLELLEQLKATGKYDVVVKLHDHPHYDSEVDFEREIRKLEDEHLRLASTLDVIPLLFLSDLLISDASSVSNEYSLLDRPMVFVDVPKLISKAAKKEESMLDLESWGRRGGAIAQTAEEVVEAVATELAHPERHAEVRRSMAADLFFNPGQSVEAAVHWLEEHCFHARLAS